MLAANLEFACATAERRSAGFRRPRERAVPIRVLVVEDESDISGLVKHALERGGDARVEIAERGDLAIDAVMAAVPDLVLLDINLPVVNGFDVCRILRADPSTARVPIIMLTARATETDRISGLDLGADDYITKPFSVRELLARVKAVLRRRGRETDTPDGTAYRGVHLVADFDAVSIAVDGIEVRLTRTEFELLRCLVQNTNRVLSRDRLLEHIRGDDGAAGARSIDVHVGRLRAKLRTAGSQVETIVGLGYRFIDSREDAGGV
jgi:DNA-binding response OmpR family regulator